MPDVPPRGSPICPGAISARRPDTNRERGWIRVGLVRGPSHWTNPRAGRSADRPVEYLARAGCSGQEIKPTEWIASWLSIQLVGAVRQLQGWVQPCCREGHPPHSGGCGRAVWPRSWVSSGLSQIRRISHLGPGGPVLFEREHVIRTPRLGLTMRSQEASPRCLVAELGGVL